MIYENNVQVPKIIYNSSEQNPWEADSTLGLSATDPHPEPNKSQTLLPTSTLYLTTYKQK